MVPAEKRHTKLQKGQEIQLELEKLLSSLAKKKLPRQKVSRKQAIAKHTELLQQVSVPLLEALDSFSKSRASAYQPIVLSQCKPLC